MAQRMILIPAELAQRTYNGRGKTTDSALADGGCADTVTVHGNIRPQNGGHTYSTPEFAKLNDLEQRVNAILARMDIDDGQKLRAYEQMYKEYQALMKRAVELQTVSRARNELLTQQENEASQSNNMQYKATEIDRLTDGEIVADAPAKARARVSQILGFLRRHASVVDYDPSTGELLLDGNRRIQGSQIKDLVYLLTRPKLPRISPVGTEEFIKALASLPSMLESWLSAGNLKEQFRLLRKGKQADLFSVKEEPYNEQSGKGAIRWDFYSSCKR